MDADINTDMTRKCPISHSHHTRQTVKERHHNAPKTNSSATAIITTTDASCTQVECLAAEE